METRKTFKPVTCYPPPEIAAEIRQLAWARQVTLSRLVQDILGAEVAKAKASGELKPREMTA